MSDQETRFDDAAALYDKGEYKKAAPLFKTLANEGYADAQYALGVCYANAYGVWHNDSKAMAWWEKAAEQGHAEAQASLGVYYLENYNITKKQRTTGFEWALKAADQGNAKGQTRVAISYDLGQGVEQDHAKALEWYTKAADQGEARAQYNIGMMYHDGKEVPQDYNKAVEWWTKAADQGLAEAQYNIGQAYNQGLGVAQDQAKAVEWWEKAAVQDHVGAQWNIGLSYDEGNGVPQDKAKAFNYFLGVAKAGYPPAQYQIGYMYSEGQGVRTDYSKAAEWYEKAAAQNHRQAQYNLAMYYFVGKGVSKNEDTSSDWASKNANNTHPQEWDFPTGPASDDSFLSGKAKVFGVIMAVIGCIAGYYVTTGFWWTLLGVFVGGVLGYTLVHIINSFLELAPKKTSGSSSSGGGSSRSSSSSRSRGSSSSGGKPVPLVVQILFAVVCGIGIFVAALWVYIYCAQLSQGDGIPGTFTLVTLGVGGGLSFFAIRSKNIPLIAIVSALAVFGYLFLAKVIPEPNRPSAATEIAVPEAVTGTTTSDVNLRAEPSGSSTLVKVLKKGETVTITGDASGSWIPIEHNGDKGWVSSEYVK